MPDRLPVLLLHARARVWQEFAVESVNTIVVQCYQIDICLCYNHQSIVQETGHDVQNKLLKTSHTLCKPVQPTQGDRHVKCEDKLVLIISEEQAIYKSSIRIHHNGGKL